MAELRPPGGRGRLPRAALHRAVGQRWPARGPELYAREPDAFDDYACTLAGLFGAQAALLAYGAEQATHLQRAVDSRDRIGQAKGILMERFDVDDEDAFQMLVRSSQETNMKLTAVAEWLTTNRRAPGRSADRNHSS